MSTIHQGASTWQLPSNVIDEFLNTGVCVVPAVISEEEVNAALRDLHAEDAMLARCGFDANDMINTGSKLSALSATNGSGGILDIYYERWKLQLNEHPRIVAAIQTLWRHSYASFSAQSNHTSSHGDIDSSSSSSTTTTTITTTVAAVREVKGRHFTHPFGEFDASRGFAYIDRICYRLPQHVIEAVSSLTSSSDPTTINSSNSSHRKKKRGFLQRSLTPHLDCCPHRMYDISSMKKWRPIQAFVALSDTIRDNEGGFEACRGLHKSFDEWARRREEAATATSPVDGTSNNTGTSNGDGALSFTDYGTATGIIASGGTGTTTLPVAGTTTATSPPCVGEFTPIRSVEDRDIIAQMRAVPCRKGDLVCWDFRIPHANARFNSSSQPRIAVYIGLLPDVPINAAFAAVQLQRYRAGVAPDDQWQERGVSSQQCDYEFSELGKKLMQMTPW